MTVGTSEIASNEQMEQRRRREKARLKLDLFYLSAGPEIGDRISRTMFDDFMHRYMGDHLPVTDIEDHARQLYAILQQQQQQAQQSSPPVEELGRLPEESRSKNRRLRSR